LPAYGGKGMYGDFVHQSVIANGEKESGITIHLIDEEYDKGQTLVQAKCPVMPDDTPGSLAARVHELEYEYFPKAIENYLLNNL
jgi:phosphoribosylglycinamide formyltransferase 1